MSIAPADVPLQGVLNVDKPAGLSSARVVAQVKRLLPRGTKIGHAGALDPFATGVLLLLVGKATKLCERLMSEPKQYVATVKLGATTETLDPESPEVETPGTTPVSRETVERILPRFVGEIEQMPPAYSALKIGGRPAYEMARKGEAVELKVRRVNVYGIELLRFEWPLVELRIDCGRGTYVRSIARDVGEAIGVGGYLTALRRTSVGEFTSDAAVTVETLQRDGVGSHLRAT
jgi:tRNA pseudouridine55 synthase